MKSGIVYLLECQGFYKIGMTRKTSINIRVGSMQVGNPFPINLVDYFDSLTPAETERGLHQFLDGELNVNRVSGEWFAIPQELINNQNKWFNDCCGLTRPQIRSGEKEVIKLGERRTRLTNLSFKVIDDAIINEPNIRNKGLVLLLSIAPNSPLKEVVSLEKSQWGNFRNKNHITLTNELHREIIKELLFNNSIYFFPSRNHGKCLDPRSFQHNIKKAFSRIGVYCTPQELQIFARSQFAVKKAVSCNN